MSSQDEICERLSSRRRNSLFLTEVHCNPRSGRGGLQVRRDSKHLPGIHPQPPADLSKRLEIREMATLHPGKGGGADPNLLGNLANAPIVPPLAKKVAEALKR